MAEEGIRFYTGKKQLRYDPKEGKWWYCRGAKAIPDEELDQFTPEQRPMQPLAFDASDDEIEWSSDEEDEEDRRLIPMIRPLRSQTASVVPINDPVVFTGRANDAKKDGKLFKSASGAYYFADGTKRRYAYPAKTRGTDNVIPVPVGVPRTAEQAIVQHQQEVALHAFQSGAWSADTLSRQLSEVRTLCENIGKNGWEKDDVDMYVNTQGLPLQVLATVARERTAPLQIELARRGYELKHSLLACAVFGGWLLPDAIYGCIVALTNQPNQDGEQLFVDFWRRLAVISPGIMHHLNQKHGCSMQEVLVEGAQATESQLAARTAKSWYRFPHVVFQDTDPLDEFPGTTEARRTALWNQGWRNSELRLLVANNIDLSSIQQNYQAFYTSLLHPERL